MDEAERHNSLSHRVIGAAIAVHRALGPGLLESTYETCLEYELMRVTNVHVERQRLVPIVYRDLIVETRIGSISRLAIPARG